jgi:hypothetical protein
MASLAALDPASEPPRLSRLRRPERRVAWRGLGFEFGRSAPFRSPFQQLRELAVAQSLVLSEPTQRISGRVFGQQSGFNKMRFSNQKNRTLAAFYVGIPRNVGVDGIEDFALNAQFDRLAVDTRSPA